MMFRKEPAAEPAELAEIPAQPPARYRPPDLKPDGTGRDAMIAAARNWDDLQQHIANIENDLHRAVAGLEAKNSEIGELRLLLEQERNNVATYRNERDQAYTERADALAILSNIRAMVEQPDIPLPARRRRNGKHPGAAGDEGTASGGGSTSASGSVVPDQTGSGESV